MSPKEILDLIDGLRARQVYAFECEHFKVSMAPAVTSDHEGDSITTFEDVKDDLDDYVAQRAEEEPVFRGYSAADLGLD